MRRGSYKIEQLLSTIRETGDSIGVYFKDQGYQVFRKYASKIRNSKIASSEEVRTLFRAYDSGYPDFMLRKDGINSFIELKLDNDSLRSNQVIFLDKLGKIADVTVLYVNNINKELLTTKFAVASDDMLRVDIRKRISSLKKVVKKRHLKPLWIIATLYKKYGDIMLKDYLLSEICSRTNIDKGKVLWFIERVKTGQIENDSLEVDEIEGNIEAIKALSRIENLRKRKERILFMAGLEGFPEWVEELTIKELLEEIKIRKSHEVI